MRVSILLFLVFCWLHIQAQNGGFYQVNYLRYSNDKVIENQDTIVLRCSKEHAIIASAKFNNKKNDFPYEFSWFSTTKLGHIHQVSYLDAEHAIATVDSSSFKNQTFEITEETKKILGYNCKKAVVKINSNTITLWFTHDLNVYGGPSAVGSHLGLILEYDRNGTFKIQAQEVKHLKKAKPINLDEYKKVPYYSLLDYRDLVWKSRFTTIPVFKNQIINFDPNHIENDLEIKVRFANGTIVARKVKFPEIASGNQIFVDATIQSNGDAYDRTASVVAIPINKKKSMFAAFQEGIGVLPVFTDAAGKTYQGVVSDDTYDAPIELMRLFTTFGIKHFNYIELKDKIWHERVPYRQDVTELRPIFSGKEVWIAMFIGNYDKGGHIVDLNFTIHQGETNFFRSERVIPLFNSTNIMEMAGQEYATMFAHTDGLTSTFTLDQPMKDVYLRYISTGHGGWENGDEFVPKINTIELNGKVIHQFIPWRQDCGSYRLFNPASGNFSNGLSSSDYSRSNWCPGMVTSPEYIYIGDLAAGQHTIRVRIPLGEKEGSSFSAWNVSGVLFGY